MNIPPNLATDGREYMEAVLNNVPNDRRRSAKQWTNFLAGEEDDALDFEGNLLHNPGEDRILPEFPTSLVDFKPSLALPLKPIPNVGAPKRERGPTYACAMGPSGSKRPAVSASEYGLSLDRSSDPRFNLQLIEHAPLQGYPDWRNLYGIEPRSDLLVLPVFRKRFTSTNGVFARDGSDPATCFLAAVTAEVVPTDDIVTCTRDDVKDCIALFEPFKETPDLFLPYKLPERRVADSRQFHGWVFGTRLGPRATGKWSNMVEGPNDQQPKGAPALRNANWRELRDFLRASQQIGMPCTTNADSQLGWSEYAFQGPEVLMQHCEGAQSILLRLEGDCR